MNLKKICFLILHYNVIEETKNCVASILNRVSYDDFHIVIVDNGSPNGTGSILKSEYDNHPKITVLLVKENMGFARGNNIGFRYCKEELQADFICAMNNDTEIIQDDFCEVLLDEYENSQYGVLGPLIHLPNNDYYRVILEKPTYASIQKDIRRQKLLRILNFFYIRDVLYYFVERRHKKRVAQKEFDKNIFKYHEGLLLNGCCLVFSPLYLKQFDGFNDATFMYREEEFIYFHCMVKGLKMVYNPNLKIMHYEDASTNQVYKKSRKKNAFFYKHSLDSMGAILTYLEKNNIG